MRAWFLLVVLLGGCAAEHRTEVSLARRPVKVRLLILKHCDEQMADDDANLAISGARAAAAKGLDIQVIGNHHVDRNGKTYQMCQYDTYDLPRLREFVSTQMKEKAASGDTVVIFTVGHGGPEGSLQLIGQRAELMQALVGAAEQNGQKVLWWQLSCHASARLPDVKSLTPNQQKYFSMVASSDANTLSPAGVEGKIMERVFVALAEKSSAIDPNGDGVITAAELSSFLQVSRRGNLVYAPSPDFPVFGVRLIVLPVVDKNNPQGRYPDDYVPAPE